MDDLVYILLPCLVDVGPGDGLAALVERQLGARGRQVLDEQLSRWNAKLNKFFSSYQLGLHSN